MDRKGRGTLILTTGLAGRRYQEKDNPEEQEIINEQLIPGAELKFEREYENRYDPWAIAVYTLKGNKLGYVPRNKNETLARLMDAGCQVIALIGDNHQTKGELTNTEDTQITIEVYTPNIKSSETLDAEMIGTVQTKMCVEEFYHGCDKLDSSIGELLKRVGKARIHDDDDNQIRKMVEYGLSKFMLYLSAVDGTISCQEAVLLYEYTGIMRSPQAILNMIKEMNLLSPEFEKTAPMCLDLFVEVENMIPDRENDSSIVRSFIELCRLIGGEILDCDEDHSPDEKDKLNRYISMMHRYAVTHLKSYGESVQVDTADSKMRNISIKKGQDKPRRINKKD